MNRAMVLNIWPMNPSFVQLAIAIVPPGRQTRTSSAATSSGRGANIAPKMVATTSKLASAIGQRLGVALVERARRAPRPPRGLRAARIELAAMSTPVTLAPRRAAISAELARAARDVEQRQRRA